LARALLTCCCAPPKPIFLLVVATVGCALGAPAAERLASGDIRLAEEARRFVARVDQELRNLYMAAERAAWALETDITPEHEAAAARAIEQRSNGVARLVKAARSFDAAFGQLDVDTQRQLQLLKQRSVVCEPSAWDVRGGPGNLSTVISGNSAL